MYDVLTQPKYCTGQEDLIYSLPLGNMLLQKTIINVYTRALLVIIVTIPDMNMIHVLGHVQALDWRPNMGWSSINSTVI